MDCDINCVLSEPDFIGYVEGYRLPRRCVVVLVANSDYSVSYSHQLGYFFSAVIGRITEFYEPGAFHLRNVLNPINLSEFIGVCLRESCVPYSSSIVVGCSPGVAVGNSFRVLCVNESI